VIITVAKKGKVMKAGDTFYLRKGMPGDPLYKCHVVTVVDECMIVYKWYGRHKQWWHYEVEDEELLCRTLNSRPKKEMD
jgi:hypothetical protein